MKTRFVQIGGDWFQRQQKRQYFVRYVVANRSKTGTNEASGGAYLRIVNILAGAVIVVAWSIYLLLL